MRLFRVVSNIARFARGVEGCLDVDDVAGREHVPGGFVVEVDDFAGGEFLVDGEDAVAAVVAGADRDGFGVQPG